MNDSQKYHHLMLAFEELAADKKLSDRIFDKENDGYGIGFRIDNILADTVFVSRTEFNAEDVPCVVKAFERAGKSYPGPNISTCVGVLLGLKRDA